jgi:hypothetical protein
MRLGDLGDEESVTLIQGVPKGTNLAIACIGHDRLVLQLCTELVEEFQGQFPFLLKVLLSGRHSGVA